MRIAGLLLLAFAAVAQTPPEVRIRSAAYAPPSAVISVESNLVEMMATVRDHTGALVGGLTRDDFELLDNGKPRPISAFAEQRNGRGVATGPRPGVSEVEAPAPRSIALFFDDMHLAGVGMAKAKLGAKKLVESGMGPGDRIGVYTDSGDVLLDLTADRAALAASIDRIKPHPQRGAKGVAICPTLTPYQAYVIAQRLDPMALQIAVAEKAACDCRENDDCAAIQAPLVRDIAAATWAAFRYQSTISLDVLRIVIRGLSHAPGQRLALIISPGFITGGMERLTTAIADEAVRAHVVINAFDAEGLTTGTESPEAKASPRHEGWAARTAELRQNLITGLLRDAATATGGRFIQNTNDFDGSLEALTAPPEISYLLAFSPGEPDEKYHPLKLQLKGGAGRRVEARPGYFSGRASTQELVQTRIDRMAVSQEVAAPFPTQVHVSLAGPAMLRVEISVDARRLKFPKKEGRSVQELTFVTLLEDEAGNFIAGKQSVMGLALTTATLAALEKDGVHAVTTFDAPKGKYRVREIVREAVENRMAAENLSVEVK